MVRILFLLEWIRYIPLLTKWKSKCNQCNIIFVQNHNLGTHNTHLETTKPMQKSVKKCFSLRASKVQHITWTENESVKSLLSFKLGWHQWNHKPLGRSWLGHYKNKVFLLTNKKFLLGSSPLAMFGIVLGLVTFDHWLQYWQLRMWIYDNLCLSDIKLWDWIAFPILAMFLNKMQLPVVTS